MAYVAARASGIVWGGLCAFHGIGVLRFIIHLRFIKLKQVRFQGLALKV